MSIRSTAKAIIIKEGEVLLNKCWDKYNGDYYSLPGGGQRKYETLYEALVRECVEETGYTIIPVKFAALCEEICTGAEFREKYPDYTHKMYHVFICKVDDKVAKAAQEKDSMQVGSEWVEIRSLSKVRILPQLVGDSILDIINGAAPTFLGSEFIKHNHG